MKYGIVGKNAVTKIPEYAPPSVATDFDELSQIDLPYNAFVLPKTERQILEEKHRAHKLQEWRDQQAQIRANLERARITPPRASQSPNNAAIDKGHVETAAEPHPSASVGADASPAPRPERSEGRVPATQANTSPKPATSTLPCPDFKQPHRTESAGPRPTPRKPPKSATPIPKAQKNAAHAAKHG